MKKYLFLAITSLFFLGCSNSENSNRNPYLPNYSFSVDINLNLPTYSTLKYVSNSVYYPNAGVRGLIIFNTNGNSYNAFDAACPNQDLSDCSTMTIKGINALCACDKKEYNLFTGQGGMPYPLKQYRVEVKGDVIRIYN
jgi:nitrite reductase/ring-hydroxylating ferredoxin subunit